MLRPPRPQATAADVRAGLSTDDPAPSPRKGIAPVLPTVAALVFQIARIAENERGPVLIEDAMLDRVDDRSRAGRAYAIVGKPGSSLGHTTGSALVHVPCPSSN
jgi:hypothetical protein